MYLEGFGFVVEVGIHRCVIYSCLKSNQVVYRLFIFVIVFFVASVNNLHVSKSLDGIIYRRWSTK